MNVAVKPWRCHLSAGSPGWDAERRLCSTWMHGCAECRAADPGIASFQPQQQYWDLVLAPATDRVTLQGLATAHTSIKMWQAYYSSVHTHLGYFVTDCPIFILLLEHVRRPSKFDGSQRKGQKKNRKKVWGIWTSIHKCTNLNPPPSFLGWLVRQWKTTDILEVKWEVQWQSFPMLNRVKYTHKHTRCGFSIFSNRSCSKMWCKFSLTPWLIHVIHSDRISLSIVKFYTTLYQCILQFFTKIVCHGEKRQATFKLPTHLSDPSFLGLLRSF